MKWNRNYHTHTTFCDGKDTAEDMVREAIRKGFVSLGFSGHSHTSFDESYAMDADAAGRYREEILRLKEKYADQLEILCGIEYDYYSDAPKEIWDYRIGSVHYLHHNGEFLPLDESPEHTRHAIECYGGDPYALAEDYFDTEARVVSVTQCDIIGHFDLIRKFDRGDTQFFDENHPRYVRAYQQAIAALVPYGVPFEINTAPTAWRRDGEMYPSRAILMEIYRQGGRITISSDSHQKETLDRGFDVALAMAQEIGFSSLTAMSPNGAVEISIAE